MNDRFKFRVWSKKYNKFIEDNRYPIGSDYQLIITQSGTLIKLGLGDFEDDCEDSYSWATFNNYEQDCIVIQCTGLKDKNNKLIYEGDIVNQIYEDETVYKCVVIYDNCSFQLKHIEDKNKNYINTPMYCYAINYLGHYTEKRLEVIGNIYENKELLEE